MQCRKHLFQETRMPALIRVSALLLAAAALSACGGGGGGGVPAGVANGAVPNDASQEEEGTEEGGVPDFVITSVAASSEVNSNSGRFHINVTIENNGTGAGPIPRAWFVTSMELPLDEKRHHIPLSFNSADGEDIDSLAPGESAVLSAVSDYAFSYVDFRPEREGLHYGQVWLNPDLSLRYVNSEDHVETSHEIEELNYTNNQSEVFTYQAVTSSRCQADRHEPNDGTDNPAFIDVGVNYSANTCDDDIDVFAVQMEADSSGRCNSDLLNTGAMIRQCPTVFLSPSNS